MNTRWIGIASFAAVLLMGMAIAGAQTPGEKDKTPPAVVPDGKDKLPLPVPDPTEAKGVFMEIMRQKGAKGPLAKLPYVALKGRIVQKGKTPAALLEVDGKLYLVNQKSVLSGSNNLTLKILELNASEVRIEVSPLNEIIVLR
jgi:hypothetical protein